MIMKNNDSHIEADTSCEGDYNKIGKNVLINLSNSKFLLQSLFSIIIYNYKVSYLIILNIVLLL